MRYLPDTNAIIGLLRDDRSPLAGRARHEQLGDLATSSIVVQELFFGAFKSARPGPNLAIFDSLRFPVIDFDRDDARRAGLIRAQLGSPARRSGLTTSSSRVRRSRAI